VADRGDDIDPVRGRSVALLLLAGATLHYGWPLVPLQYQWDFWNAVGAACRLGLLVVVLRHSRGVALWVGAWWACEEALVIGCSTWHIISPFPRPAGDGQCRALLNFDFDPLGALAMLACALAIARSYRYRDSDPP